MNMDMNKKIKVFNFEVSNCAHGADKEREHEVWYKTNKPKLVSYEDIETILNNFLKGKVLVDVKVNTVDVKYHNNALSNTIILVYTVIYLEENN